MVVRELIAEALSDLEVYGAGETPTPEDQAKALSKLNAWLDQLGAERRAMATVTRTAFPILASTANYAITGSPTWIDRVAYLDATTHEIALIGPLTDEEWQDIIHKTHTGTPQVSYYNGTVADGTLSLWPVPESDLDGIYYVPTPVAEFASVEDAITIRRGYRRFFTTHLAMEIAPAFGVQPSPLLIEAARDSSLVVRSSNHSRNYFIRTADDGMPGSGASKRRPYDIRLGSGTLFPVSGFAGGSNADRAAAVGVERTVNLFPAKVGENWILRQCPGYTEVCELPLSPVRGLFTINGRTFAVGGAGFYEIDVHAGYAVSSYGGVQDDGRVVTMLTNGEAGNQILIVSNNAGFVFDLETTSLDQAVTFPPSRIATFIDGYGVALSSSTSTFALSGFEDFSTWDALDTQQRQMGADQTITLGVNHRELLILGESTSEVWYNSGDATFPFVPRDGVFLEVGSAAARSGANVDNAWHWLGRSAQGGRVAFRLDGYTPKRISTDALEQTWAGYAVIDDAVGYGAIWEGHAWYVLSFPSEGATWVFDSATGAWHERLTWRPTLGEYHAYRGWVHTVTGPGVHLIGDYQSGRIFALSPTVYTDDEYPLRWLRRCPHVTKNGARVTYRRAELEMDLGIGLPTGQGSDPQVQLRWSRDKGHSWQDAHWQSAGAIGEYRDGYGIAWRRLGRGRSRTFEIAGADPVPFTLLNLLVDAA